MKSNKVLVFSILTSLVVLVATVWIMNWLCEDRVSRYGQAYYVASFKERLALFGSIDKREYGEAHGLLAMLLVGDIMVYDRVSGDINPKEIGICSRLSSNVKEELVSLHQEGKCEDDFTLNLEKLEARCAE